MNLTGRVARCGSNAKIPGSGHAEQASSPTLAFFEYRGEGSRAATDVCRHCGYAEVAHEPGAPVWRSSGKTAVETHGCPGFEPHGPWECDTYYCGCRGWD
jgi:hypothetical protein